MSQKVWTGDPGRRVSVRQARSAGRERRTRFCAGSNAAPQAARLSRDLRGSGAFSRTNATLRFERPGPSGARHSASERPRGPRRPHCPAARPLSPAPRALSRVEFTGPLNLNPRGPAPGQGSENGALTSCRPDRLGILKFKCLSQQRFRVSVFRYLFSFFPVSKFPLRAVPLVKTGHPLRSPPNK